MEERLRDVINQGLYIFRKVVNLQDIKINMLGYNLHGDTKHILLHFKYIEWLHPGKKREWAGIMLAPDFSTLILFPKETVMPTKLK